jgi:hypothetical protein
LKFFFTSPSAEIGLVRAAIVEVGAFRSALARPFVVVSGCASSVASVANGNEIGAAVVVCLAGRIALAGLGQIGSANSAPTDAGIVSFATTQNNCNISKFQVILSKF